MIIIHEHNSSFLVQPHSCFALLRTSFRTIAVSKRHPIFGVRVSHVQEYLLAFYSYYFVTYNTKINNLYNNNSRNKLGNATVKVNNNTQVHTYNWNCIQFWYKFDIRNSGHRDRPKIWYTWFVSFLQNVRNICL